MKADNVGSGKHALSFKVACAWTMIDQYSDCIIILSNFKKIIIITTINK